MFQRLAAAVVLFALVAGCGTTKWSNTQRTATEQLLISDSIDRAVSGLDFRALAGKKVFLDTTAVARTTDSAYLVGSLKQHLLASGCILKEKKDEADYVVEARAGAVGTDHHDVLFGVPSVTVPTGVPLASVPSSIPEIPLVKKTEQRAVTKVCIFAYNRVTGRPVWQSGEVLAWSKAKDVWVFGAGPFQRGTIYEGTRFAGDKVSIPLVNLDDESSQRVVSVADQAYFVEPPVAEVQQAGAEAPADAAEKPTADAASAVEKPSEVVQASHTEPAAESSPKSELAQPTAATADAPRPVQSAAPLPPGDVAAAILEAQAVRARIVPWWETKPPRRLRPPVSIMP